MIKTEREFSKLIGLVMGDTVVKLADTMGGNVKMDKTNYNKAEIQMLARNIIESNVNSHKYTASWKTINVVTVELCNKEFKKNNKIEYTESETEQMLNNIDIE